jgi:hypothetical protein
MNTSERPELKTPEELRKENAELDAKLHEVFKLAFTGDTKVKTPKMETVQQLRRRGVFVF